jgi:hypothetical protein
MSYSQTNSLLLVDPIHIAPLKYVVRIAIQENEDEVEEMPERKGSEEGAVG